MAIYFSSENLDFELENESKVKKWISAVVNAQNRRVGNINYLFCDDAYLININRTYLNHDTYTDIITFDYVEGNVVSGDIMISVERVKENATLFSTTFEQELHRVVIHGVLHLLGQADKTDEEATEMRKKEEAALALWNTIV
jgi:rRNA maturation RNase YbeY